MSSSPASWNFGPASIVLLATILAVAGCTTTGDVRPRSSGMRSIAPAAASEPARAVVVDDLPLVHTSQLLPLDSDGRLVGSRDVDAQINAVLDNLRQVLAAVGSDLDDVAKLNIYVRDADVSDRIRHRLTETFRGAHKPAVSYVETALPRSDAAVALDAVAVTHQNTARTAVHRVSGVYAPSDAGHIAVMPRGRRVYISGQVAPGDLETAAAETMQGLLATLAYAGMSADDVVQVKAFLHPAQESERLHAVVRRYFNRTLAPPFVAVEWTGGEYLDYLSLDPADGPLPTEIEIVAARDEDAASDEVVRYSAPPWMSQPATYARIAEVSAGPMIYVSGLYGTPGEGAEAELRSMFDQLRSILDAAGGDFDHLLKGTYYVTSKEADDGLNQIRTEYYDPTRAPTSSKMPVRGTGVSGTTVTFDMIGAVP